jgi:hypothetical protein
MIWVFLLLLAVLLVFWSVRRKAVVTSTDTSTPDEPVARPSEAEAAAAVRRRRGYAHKEQDEVQAAAPTDKLSKPSDLHSPPRAVPPEPQDVEPTEAKPTEIQASLIEEIAEDEPIFRADTFQTAVSDMDDWIEIDESEAPEVSNDELLITGGVRNEDNARIRDLGSALRGKFGQWWAVASENWRGQSTVDPSSQDIDGNVQS